MCCTPRLLEDGSPSLFRTRLSFRPVAFRAAQLYFIRRQESRTAHLPFHKNNLATVVGLTFSEETF
jgi:hypothetical protein